MTKDYSTKDYPTNYHGCKKKENHNPEEVLNLTPKDNFNAPKNQHEGRSDEITPQENCPRHSHASVCR
jgi:hypothetical protein